MVLVQLLLNWRGWMGLDDAAWVSGGAKPSGEVSFSCVFPWQWPGAERGTCLQVQWVVGMGTQGRKCRGQILAVLLDDKNNLGSRHSIDPTLDEVRGRLWRELVWAFSTDTKSWGSWRENLSARWGWLGAFQNKGFYARSFYCDLKISENKVSHREISGSLILLFLLWVVLTSHMPHCSGWTNRALRLRAGTCAQAPLSCVSCDFGVERFVFKESRNCVIKYCPAWYLSTVFVSGLVVQNLRK